MIFCLRNSRCPFPGSIFENGEQKKEMEFNEEDSTRILQIEREMLKLEKETLNFFLDRGIEVKK